MGWVYFLAGLFIGNATAFVAIVLAQSMRRSEELLDFHQTPVPVSDPPL